MGTETANSSSSLESLDVEVDEDTEAAWRREIERRLHEIESGAVKLMPWDEAKRRLGSRLKP
ncbi:MAG TPA: addiction module protein [Bryobacteraceae bacterium]|nr:addiction module protein [Bryobacteraceae bacterium]